MSVTNLDTLITESDPARAVLLVPLDGQSAAARVAAHARLAHRRRRARLIGTGVAAVLLGGAAAGYATLGGPPPTSSAKTTLARLAAATARDAAAFGPGQYLYIKSEDERQVTIQQRGHPLATATYSEIVQRWLTSEPGQGQITVTPIGSLTFSSPQDEAAWQADPLSATVSLTHVTGTTPAPATEATFNVSSLPTDPTTLAKLLASGDTGIPRLDQISGSDPTFARAIALLFTPVVGLTPALEAATFQVLEALPEVQVTSSHDELGRNAVVISVPGTAAHVLVDPSTGQPLELVESFPVRSLTTPGILRTTTTGRSIPPASQVGTSLLWQATVSQSVVNSLAPPTTATAASAVMFTPQR